MNIRTKMKRTEFINVIKEARSILDKLGINILAEDSIGTTKIYVGQFYRYDMVGDHVAVVEITPDIPAKGELVFAMEKDSIYVMRSMGTLYYGTLECEMYASNCIHQVKTWCQVSDKSIHSDEWDPRWVEMFG